MSAPIHSLQVTIKTNLLAELKHQALNWVIPLSGELDGTNVFPIPCTGLGRDLSRDDRFPAVNN